MVGSAVQGETMKVDSAIIDDLSRDPPLSAIGTRWQLFTDRVMGGVSNGTMVREMVAGRPAIRMRGDVSLENNGGFIQIALDLAADGKAIDASAWRGIELSDPDGTTRPRGSGVCAGFCDDRLSEGED